MKTRHHGFSLVEVAIALAIIGLLVVGVVSLVVLSERQDLARQQASQLTRAERSLLAYAYQNNRLPCPASDSNGLEDCSSGQKGFLPWQTLGLPDRSAGNIRYGVYRGGGDSPDLTNATDRLEPLGVSVLGTVQSLSLDNVNLIDFCVALGEAGKHTQGTVDTDSLRIVRTDAEHNVAYALAAPGWQDADGDGDPFDGANSDQQQPRFTAPGTRATHSNDDKVVAAGFESLAAYYSCGQAVSAIGHSHFNAAASARVMEITIKEYATLLELQRRKAEATAVSASATVATAAGGIANAVAQTTLAVAQAIGSYGALSPIIAVGITAVVANTYATVQAAVALGFTIDGVTEAKNRESRANQLVTDAEGLAESAEDNALAADQRGF